MNLCDVIVLLFLTLTIAGPTNRLVVECGPGEYVDTQLMECRDCPENTYSSTRDHADNFLQILLPVVITVLIVTLVTIVVSICYREKIFECLNLMRNCREHVYQMVLVNGGNQRPAVNHPPQHHRNVSLGTGNDVDEIHRQFNGSDLRPATPSLEREVPSDGDVEVSFQVIPPPPHDDPILPEVLPNEALVPLPNNQALPLESETAGENSTEQAAAILPESRPDGCSSHLFSHPDDLLPDVDYAQARLLFGSTDIQDSLIEHNSDDLGASTSNTVDIRGSRTMLGLDEHRSLSSLSGTQDNRRTSARPCARVRPLVITPQPNLNLQGNNPQHAPFHPQHPQMIHPQQYQPNNPPDVPSQIVDVESVYSVDSLSQDELT